LRLPRDWVRLRRDECQRTRRHRRCDRAMGGRSRTAWCCGPGSDLRRGCGTREPVGAARDRKARSASGSCRATTVLRADRQEDSRAAWLPSRGLLRW